MFYYKISLSRRGIIIGNRNNLKKCMTVGNKGMFVCFDNVKQLTDDNILRYLAGIEEKKTIVESNSPEEAVKRFYQEWEGARIGGEKEYEKALWINRKVPILELPNCKLIHKNKNDEYTCGEVEESGNGEYGMCVLEEYDPPENCPINLFYRISHSENFSEAFKEKKFLFGGLEYSVIKPSGFYNRIKRSYKIKIFA